MRDQFGNRIRPAIEMQRFVGWRQCATLWQL
jgi:hypothetical protein